MTEDQRRALTAQDIIAFYDGPRHPMAVWAAASHQDVKQLAAMMIRQLGEDYLVAEGAQAELVSILTERRREQRETNAQAAAEAERTAWINVDVEGTPVHTRRAWPERAREMRND